MERAGTLPASPPDSIIELAAGGIAELGNVVADGVVGPIVAAGLVDSDLVPSSGVLRSNSPHQSAIHISTSLVELLDCRI